MQCAIIAPRRLIPVTRMQTVVHGLTVLIINARNAQLEARHVQKTRNAVISIVILTKVNAVFVAKMERDALIPRTVVTSIAQKKRNAEIVRGEISNVMITRQAWNAAMTKNVQRMVYARIVRLRRVHVRNRLTAVRGIA